MRRLIVSTYMTLDGRVDAVQDWATPFDDPTSVEYHSDLMRHSDGLVLGRGTYELFAALWPPRAGTVPYVDQFNRMAKHVVSTTATDLEWENSHLLRGDPVEAISRLKDQPGDDLVMYGCHDLMHSLLGHGLIDEQRILISPVLLGRGRSFLDDGAPRVDLELVDTVVKSSGVVVLTYR